MGDTALSLSCDWPDGMQLLLAAGAGTTLTVDDGPREMSRAQEFACRSLNIQVVTLLASAGGIIDPESSDTEYIPSALATAMNLEYNSNDRETVGELTDILSALLCESRRELHALLMGILGPSTLPPQPFSKDRGLDEFASIALFILRQNNIRVPLMLTPHAKRRIIYYPHLPWNT